jgi:tol-pal system protein YbgF
MPLPARLAWARLAWVWIGVALIGAAPAYPAASAQSEQAAAQTELRLQQLEDQVRSLTGQVETQNHRIDLLTQQLEKMRSDTELRLNDLEGKGGGAVSGPSPAAAASGPQYVDPGDSASRAYSPPAVGAPTPLVPGIAGPGTGAGRQGPGAPPRSLGTLPADAAPPADPDIDPDSLTPKGQYEQAYAMIDAGEYADAERAFKSFIAQYPKDPLAGSAAYWIGHTYYARGDFQGAAVAFADSYRKYPKGNKAPDSLLDLGRSLGKLGNTADACATFAQLDRQFGATANANIKRQEQQEKSRLKCG